MINKTNYSLLHHNTFGIDAKCSRFIEIKSTEEAVGILPAVSRTKYLILGGGSNILFTKDYDGTVVHSGIKGIETEEHTDSVTLRCGSGENWDEFIAFCVGHNYYGAENLSLIPGDVGASAVQNIGAYGAEVKDIIESVEAVEIATGRQVTFSNEDCRYAYRHSRFKSEWKNKFFITFVSYRLSRHFSPHLNYGNIRTALSAKGIDKPTATELRDTIIEIRRKKLPDPDVQGNAGSFFMNPIVDREIYEKLALQYPNMPHYKISDTKEKIPAGWMIEQCGWKGKSLGNAGVHDKQALVLVNRGGATGNEIVRLCEYIRSDVMKKFGIEIKPEVNII
jgi:UDP-N-acetylmuramate dehydrogenase